MKHHEDQTQKVYKLPGVSIITSPGTLIIKAGRTTEEEITGRCKHHITETEEKYIIQAEIPGTKKEDIKIYTNSNIISIKAKPYIKLPWTPEEYRAKIKLENQTEPEKAKAKYEDGILTIEIPKKNEVKELPIE